MWYGPGEYVPDPTEGIIDVNDLPAPQIVAYDRNHEHTSCPRCGHLAYRHKWGHRTLHDLGDLYRNCRPRSSDRPLYAFITSAIGERPQYNLLKINILNFSGILPYALISH